MKVNIKKRIVVTIVMSIIIFLTLILSIGCGQTNQIDNKENEIITTEEENKKEEIKEPIKEPIEVNISVVGDILLHTPIIDAYRNDSYNFDSIFKYVKPYIEKSDYSIANMEGLTSDNTKYTGYPLFNAPTTILDALKNSGFDMLLGSNNHRADGGYNTFIDSINQMEQRNLDYVGIKKSKEEKSYLVKDIEGIKVGFINYTYNTGVNKSGQTTINGIPLSSELEGLIDNYNQYNLEGEKTKLKQTINNVKNDGAEFIVFLPHWGEEYYNEPRQVQKDMAQFLCNEGINVIVGGHPHVLEPITTISSNNGSTNTLVMYSLGNFISNQRLETMGDNQGECGIIFDFTILKDPNTNTISLKNYNYTSTWVRRYNSNGNRRYEIIPTKDINTIEGLSNNEKERITNADSLIDSILNMYK